MSQPGKKDPGAPTKLTPELIDKISSYIRLGAYVETAAASAGVHKATFYEWMKKGAQKKSGLCRALNDAVSKAVADGELRDLKRIEDAAQGTRTAILLKDETGKQVVDKDGMNVYIKPMDPDWKAAAWKMERRNPKQWGPRQTIEHGGKDGEPLKFIMEVVDPADGKNGKKG